MLLGLVSILSIVVGVIGAAVWLFTRQRATMPQTARAPAALTPAIAATATAAAAPPAAAQDFTSTVWDLDPQEAAAPIAEVEPLSVEEIYLRQHRLALTSLGVGEAWPSAHD